MPDLGILTTAVQSFVGTGVLAWGAVVTWQKAKREGQDAEETRLESHMTRQDGRITELENRLDRAARRERIRDDYIQSLRTHISLNLPPPPPPWPESLVKHEHD